MLHGWPPNLGGVFQTRLTLAPAGCGTRGQLLRTHSHANTLGTFMRRIEFEKSRILPEHLANPPDGITIIDSGKRIAGMSADVLIWATFTLTISAKVDLAVAARFLYEAIRQHFKTPPKTITMNRVTIEFEEGQIKKFIEETVTETEE